MHDGQMTDGGRKGDGSNEESTSEQGKLFTAMYCSDTNFVRHEQKVVDSNPSVLLMVCNCCMCAHSERMGIGAGGCVLTQQSKH